MRSKNSKKRSKNWNIINTLYVILKKQHLILLGLIAVLNSSCYTYKIYPKEYRKLQNLKDKKNVYLINDYNKKEAEILKHSDIFNITTDSTKADLKIKLYPLKNVYYTEDNYTVFGWNAGGDLSFGLITLGQLPIFYDETLLFQYDEIKQDIIIKRNFELRITRRIWFWDMFGLNKRFEEKVGKALLGSYINNK